MRFQTLVFATLFAGALGTKPNLNNDAHEELDHDYDHGDEHDFDHHNTTMAADHSISQRDDGNPNTHGDRYCLGGGITCNYNDGSRCSKACEGDCWCPNGHWDDGVYHDGYKSAGCVYVLTAQGRHQC